MMRHFLPYLLTLLLTASAYAEPVLPILIVSDSGYAWMIQGEDGLPIIYKFSQVVVIGKPTQGVPPVTPKPAEFGLAAQIPGWLSSVSDKSDLPAIKKALTEVTTMSLSPEKLKTLGEVEAVTGALLSSAISQKAVWGVFGANLNKALVQLQADKKIITPADYGRALTEVVKALP